MATELRESSLKTLTGENVWLYVTSILLWVCISNTKWSQLQLKTKLDNTQRKHFGNVGKKNKFTFNKHKSEAGTRLQWLHPVFGSNFEKSNLFWMEVKDFFLFYEIVRCHQTVTFSRRLWTTFSHGTEHIIISRTYEQNIVMTYIGTVHPSFLEHPEHHKYVRGLSLYFSPHLKKLWAMFPGKELRNKSFS